MVFDLNLKLEGVENELDIRVESLISLIHDCRDKCKVKLDEFKQDFIKLTFYLKLDFFVFNIYSCFRECENNLNFETINEKFI